MIRLPPASIFWPTVRTSVLAWLVLRLVMGAGAIYMAPGLEFLGPAPVEKGISPVASFLLMLGVAGVVLADLRRTREGIWVQNLGVSRRAIAGTAFLLAGILEVGVWAGLRIWGGGS